MTEWPPEWVEVTRQWRAAREHNSAESTQPPRERTPRSNPGARTAEQPSPRTRAKRHQLFQRFPEEFRAGVKAGFTASGTYPGGFRLWPEARRNAWFAGWNVGRCDRLRELEKGAAA